MNIWEYFSVRLISGFNMFGIIRLLCLNYNLHWQKKYEIYLSHNRYSMFEFYFLSRRYDCEKNIYLRTAKKNITASRMYIILLYFIHLLSKGKKDFHDVDWLSWTSTIIILHVSFLFMRKSYRLVFFLPTWRKANHTSYVLQHNSTKNKMFFHYSICNSVEFCFISLSHCITTKFWNIGLLSNICKGIFYF